MGCKEGEAGLRDVTCVNRSESILHCYQDPLSLQSRAVPERRFNTGVGILCVRRPCVRCELSEVMETTYRNDINSLLFVMEWNCFL